MPSRDETSRMASHGPQAGPLPNRPRRRGKLISLAAQPAKLQCRRVQLQGHQSGAELLIQALHGGFHGLGIRPSN